MFYLVRMKRRLCLGDAHGGMKALEQVLDRAGFNPEEDQLISLGDLVDGWAASAQVVEYIKNLPNHVLLKGNHDYWAASWLRGGPAQHSWTSQGGAATIDSYKNCPELRKPHGEYLSQALPYYIDEDNNLYVHGGFNWHYPIKDQDPYELMWDRDLWEVARYWQKQSGYKNTELYTVKDYNEVFIGHTTTSREDPELKPVHASNVWNLDQGGGFEGKLTLMDTRSHEYWQSDMVKELYPNAKGR